MQGYFPVVIDKNTGQQKILKGRHVLTESEASSLGIFPSIQDSVESNETKQIVIPGSIREFYLTAKDSITNLIQVYNFKVQYIASAYELFIQSIFFNGNQSSLFFDDSIFSLSLVDSGDLKLTLKSVHNQPLNLTINK